MDSFFLSKSIEGEAEGAKECAPHSARPCMPPSCSCTLPFVCPLCAQSREGVGHRLRVGRAPRFACPRCAYTGDGAPLPCPRGLPFARSPCAQAGGRGGAASRFTRVPGCVSPCAQSGGRVVPPPGLPLACPLGAQTGKAPLLFHTPPV